MLLTKIEKQIMAMELAMYMCAEGRTFEQAWQEKMLPQTHSFTKRKIKRLTKKLVIAKMF